MKKFLLKTLSTLLASVLLVVIMFFCGVSLYSGKLPPTLAMAKESINNLIKAKDNYTNMLHKSEKYLKNQMTENQGAAAGGEGPPPENVDIEELNTYMKQVKIQLNRIEQQNAQIINSLKK